VSQMDAVWNADGMNSVKLLYAKHHEYGIQSR